MRRATLLLAALLAWPLAAQQASRFTLPISSGGTADPLTVLGPAGVCADQQIALWNGASATSLQCSVLTVADTTGNLTGPSGGFSIIGGTAATDDLILDGSAGTAGYSKVSETGTLLIGTTGTTTLGYDHLNFRNTGAIGWSATGSAVLTTVTDGDVRLYREYGGSAVGVLAQRAGTQAQTYRLYGLADVDPLLVTNYERLSLSCDGTADCTIATETAGTGSDDMRLNLVTGGNAGVLMRRHVTADIDGETTTAANSGTVWTNTGDGDGESITLLNDPTIGVNYCFAVDVAQTITVAPSSGESLYYGTDQCVVSLTSNSIGSTLCVTAITGGSGAKWMTFSSMGSWTCND